MERKERTGTTATTSMDKNDYRTDKNDYRDDDYDDDRRDDEEDEEEHYCHCHGDCHRRFWAKLLGALIVFLAGMGFHALVQCGPCPARASHPYAGVYGRHMPSYRDGQGNIIIINPDGQYAGAENCNCDMKSCGNNSSAANANKDFKRNMKHINKHQKRGGFIDSAVEPLPAENMGDYPLPASQESVAK